MKEKKKVLNENQLSNLKANSFNSDSGRAAQKLSAKKRVENRLRKLIIREVLEDELLKEFDEHNKKIDVLIARAVDNAIKRARLDDIETLSRLMGESKLTLNMSDDDFVKSIAGKL